MDVIPQEIRERYELRETRNAAQILAATHPAEFEEILEVLRDFRLVADDITQAGGNKSRVATRLDREFRRLGWREGRHDTTLKSVLKVMPYAAEGEKTPRVIETEVTSEGYKVDNVKGRLALDVEWNAKDGNLDRDMGAYRALYDAGVIDGGVIITRTQEDLRGLATRLGVKRFDTTTTTNLVDLRINYTRVI
ncbi:MAG: BglII/BstYI family type II restriction endonuclease [Actinomycetota bacterium]